MVICIYCRGCDSLAFKGRNIWCLCFAVASACIWGPCGVGDPTWALSFPLGVLPERGLPWPLTHSGVYGSGRIYSDKAALGAPWPHIRVCQGGVVVQGKRVGQWLLAGDGYISILPGTRVETLAPVLPREENMPGAAYSWGANEHMFTGLMGISSSKVIFHMVRGGRRKGSITCQTQGTLKHKVFQICLGFEGLGVCVFLELLILYSHFKWQALHSLFSVEREQTDWPSGCSGMKGHSSTRQTHPLCDLKNLLVQCPSAWPGQMLSSEDSRKVRTQTMVLNQKEREERGKELIKYSSREKNRIERM